MIDAVATAIYDIYNADTALKALVTGGFWFQEAPEGVSGNYAVYDFDSTGFDEMMGAADNSIKNNMFIVNVFVQNEDGSSAMSSIIDKIRDLYNWQALAITGYDFISSQISSFNTVIKDNEYWQVTANLEIKFS